MKKLIFVMFALCSFMGVQYAQGGQKEKTLNTLSKAQQDSLILAFVEFTDGYVYKMDGSRIPAKLNYNYFNQEVLFLDDKKEIMKLNSLSDVSIIKIGKRSFLPVGNILSEIIVDGAVGLAESKKVNVTEKKTGAYGTGGSTASISNVSGIQGGGGTRNSQDAQNAGSRSMSGADYSGSANQHTFSSDAVFSIDIRYFLVTSSGAMVCTKKNFRKAFPQQRAAVDAYIAEQNPDFGKREDMQLFLTYLLGL